MKQGWFSRNFAYIGSFINEDGAEGYQYVCTGDLMTIRAEIDKRELAQTRVAQITAAMKAAEDKNKRSSGVSK